MDESEFDDFQHNQWWVNELQSVAITDDQKRALFVVHNLIGQFNEAMTTIEQQEEEINRLARDLDLLANQSVYNGNSVVYIYQKMIAYRNTIDQLWDAARAAGHHPDGQTSIVDIVKANIKQVSQL